MNQNNSKTNNGLRDAASPQSGSHTRVTTNEYQHNQILSKKGGFSNQISGGPSYETTPASKQSKAIGWGTQSKSLKHELVNVQKPRFAKPTLKYLDNAKDSNFINFLYTKRNEINH